MTTRPASKASRTLAAAVAGAALFAAHGALAHAILMSSTPAIGGSVPAGDLAIALHYNSRLDARRSRVTLAGPDATTAADAHRLAMTASDAKDELDGHATVRPGAYVLRWQALALDGHITRGEVPFTVTAPK